MNKTKVALTVEEHLNGVDYSDNGSYIPTKFSAGFLAFIQMANDGNLENKSPVIHYKVIDKFDAPHNVKAGRIINLMHRGLAKTTLVRYLILYIAAFGELPHFGHVGLAIYVSDSIENGVKNMRKNLEYQWENSKFLQEWIPEAKFTDIRWEFKNKDGKSFVVKGYGAKTGVRGVSELNIRPKLALLDDLLSDSDARSATVIADIEDTVYNAVKFALHPEHNKIIWNGTPFNAADPLYKAVESGAWEVNVYPVCERYPCTREEFKGSWEDRFSYDYVKKEYEDAVQVGRMHSFDQELMLRIMSDEDRMITEDDLRWYESKDLPQLLPFLNIYVTTDWATSERQSADFSGTNAWGINNNGDWYWLAGVCVRQTMDKNIETLFNYVTNYRPISVGIEVSGQQGGFIPWIKQEMVRRNTFFTLASSNNGGREGIKPSTDKLQRFNVVVPWFKQGKMYFPQDKQATDPALREMLSEIRLVSPAGFKSKHDDQLDNVSQLALLNAYKPGYAMPNTVLPDSPFAVSMSTEHSSNSYFV